MQPDLAFIVTNAGADLAAQRVFVAISKKSDGCFSFGDAQGTNCLILKLV